MLVQCKSTVQRIVIKITDEILTNNSNKDICIAPYGRNFRGAKQ